MSKKIAEKIREIVEPIAENMQVELVDVEYVKEGPDYFLRIYVDKEDGIDIDTCSAVSEAISEQLDELDPIPHVYMLEVSSPGAERPLKKDEDFTKAIGKNVFVSFYEPIEGSKAYEGILQKFDGETITLLVTNKTRKKEFTLPYDKIASARLAILF